MKKEKQQNPSEGNEEHEEQRKTLSFRSLRSLRLLLLVSFPLLFSHQRLLVFISVPEISVPPQNL